MSIAANPYPTSPRPAKAWRTLVPTLRYWMETEVHVYAFSIAANVLLSFFPFLIVMLSLCRLVHWHAASSAVYVALNSYFPDEFGVFLKRNLVATVESRGPFQIASVVLLLFTANGIFEPLEVALNRVWGISRNRSFWKNQLVSLGLIFACGGLALLSTTVTATSIDGSGGRVASVLASLVFRLCAIPLSILGLFLVYWLLPNGKIPPDRVLLAALIVGLLLEILKYVNLLTWPWLRAKLTVEYGPFIYSVTIILWSFAASLVVLAGAEWTARRMKL